MVDLLYVVHDGECIVVSLDLPGVDGAVEESAYGAVEVIRLSRESTLSAVPPGLRSSRAWYGFGAVAGLSAGVTATAAVSPSLGLPLTVASAVALALGYRRRRRVLAEAWQERHRVLRHTADTHAFSTARAAAERIIDLWPRLATMVGVPDPGPALAESLWTLSEVLVNRGALRDQRDELDQIRADLPPDTDLTDEVDDRLAALDTALNTLDTEVDARLAAFTSLSRRCRRYVREEQAVARARDAVQRADQALGTPLADHPPDPGRELADRTAAVLDAYRELTR